MKKISGAYGIVITLDHETAQAVQALVKTVDADYKTVNTHLTLFHTRLKDADPNALKQITEKCRQRLQGQQIALDRISVFGDNFLFWDATPSKELVQAHEIALELSQFLDQDLHTHTKGEELTLTPEQERNIRLYGHPFVKEQYRPHITLAYHHSGFPSLQGNERLFREAKVEKTIFAEIGEFGRVLQEIDLQHFVEHTHEARHVK